MAHQGYEHTMELLRPCVYWPTMYREVRDYISSCERCTMGHAPELHTTSSLLLANHPHEILTINFTKLETASDRREHFHVLTCIFLKFTRAFQRAIRKQGQWPRYWFMSAFNTVGFPRRSTAQGRDFESKLVKSLCELYGIQKTPDHCLPPWHYTV